MIDYYDFASAQKSIIDAHGFFKTFGSMRKLVSFLQPVQQKNKADKAAF